MARARRQPKRILNCIPSREREDDWKLDTAEDSGVLDAAPRDAREEGSPPDVVEDPGSGIDGLLRRLGLRRWPSALALREDEPDRPERADLTPLPMDGRQGDRRLQLTAHDVRRGRGDERQGRARGLPQVRRGSRLRAPVRDRAGRIPETRRPSTRSPPSSRSACISTLGASLENWRLWLATKGPILTRLERRLDLGPRHREQGKARRLRAADGARRPRGRARRLHRRRRSSCATAGARPGATRALPTPRSPMRRTLSPRRTESSRRVARSAEP